MKQIMISIVYEEDKETDLLDQVKVAKFRYVPKDIKMTEVSFEKEWITGKSKITFKGVEQ